MPCVLVVADPERVVELVGALSEPLPTTVVSKIEVLVSSGGDEAVELFQARKPHVIVVTATLEAGDTAALVDALRGMLPRAEVGVVVIGDPEGGSIRNALDAIDLAPDRFVSRPMAPRTLRFAVASALEAVILARGPAQAAPGPAAPRASGTSPGSGPATGTPQPVLDEPTDSSRAALRRRWEALADSMADASDDDEDAGARTAAADAAAEVAIAAADAAEVAISEEAAPLPPPILLRPRRSTSPGDDTIAPPQAWRPGTTAELSEKPWPDIPPLEPPVREPTLIIRDPAEQAPPPAAAPPVEPAAAAASPPGRDRPDDRWSEPVPRAALLGRDSARELVRELARDSGRELGRAMVHELDEIDDDLVIVPRPSDVRLEVLADLPDEGPPAPSSTSDGRDFARQLRARMSQMAQRLFQGADTPAPAPADLAPRHDHSTEIDLSSLGEDLPLAGVTEVGARARPRAAIPPELITAPGSWDSQVRERGLPEQGEIVRGVSDAAMLLAKMFAGGATGRIHFKRDDVETIVYFDQGRPVFASSSETLDRMGGLLVREGKITASQYERCQSVVAESGRRMGEILVDFGYLKRRELLPAVRRHVEDIVYALFGWDRGHYQIALDPQPSAERIRLSRHPASLVLEGIRRKLGRSTLERLLGPSSTVIEVSDRERLGGIINMGDLTSEERASLAAFDGQADLAQVARIAGIDVADVLPLAWGLCVLGLATARRADTEVHEESTALVGETDLAIDRERVRARWQLVTDADYFALLGVRRDATAFEIRRAYQAARRDFAADGFPGDLRRELARELDDIASVLDEAFRVLRDDRLRQTYLANLVG